MHDRMCEESRINTLYDLNLSIFTSLFRIERRQMKLMCF